MLYSLTFFFNCIIKYMLLIVSNFDLDAIIISVLSPFEDVLSLI